MPNIGVSGECVNNISVCSLVSKQVTRYAMEAIIVHPMQYTDNGV